jgi:hypothetical protein
VCGRTRGVAEAELGVHPRRTIGAAAGTVDVDDPVGEIRVVKVAGSDRLVRHA